MKNNRKKETNVSSNHRTLTLLWIVQVLGQVLATLVIWQLNMLPDLYFMILAGLMAVLALLTGILMLSKKKATFRHTVGVLLSLAVFGVSCAGAVLVMDVQDTIQGVSGSTGSIVAQAVYVRVDDPAQTIQDAADYEFGIVQDYDVENTQKAILSIETELDRDLRVREFESAEEMVASFLSGDVDALILNSAYAVLLEDLEGYEDFYDRIRILHEVEVMVWTPAKDDPATEQTNIPIQSQKIEDITTESFVVYISGSDTRSKKLTTSRSDVNILAVVNPVTKQVLLLNTPRDYYISNPASRSGAMDKLTHCGIYGIECSMQALANLYQVEVDYYAQINFTGFETLIDAIGGVTVHSDVSFSNSAVVVRKGENTFNGSQALAFARERKRLSGGDNDRGKNQMKVIEAVIAKATSGTTIISNYTGIMGSLEGMFTTSMNSDEISKLVKMQLDDMAQWNVQTYAVTGRGGSDKTYSIPGARSYVMYQDARLVNHGIDLINRVIAGEILTEADMTAPNA